MHDRAVQQLLHQQHTRQWDRYTGDIAASVTIKPQDGRFMSAFIFIFYDEVVQSGQWTE